MTIIGAVIGGGAGYAIGRATGLTGWKLAGAVIGGALIGAVIGGVVGWGVGKLVGNTKAIQPGTLTGSLNKLEIHERQMINDLLAKGKHIEIIPRSNIQGVQTADFYVNGVKTELKSLFGNSPQTAVNRIYEAFNKPADYVILDARNTMYTAKDFSSIFARAAGKFSSKALPGTVEVWLKNKIIYGGIF